jgi:hypothetical protein
MSYLIQFTPVAGRFKKAARAAVVPLSMVGTTLLSPGQDAIADSRSFTIQSLALDPTAGYVSPRAINDFGQVALQAESPFSGSTCLRRNADGSFTPVGPVGSAPECLLNDGRAVFKYADPNRGVRIGVGDENGFVDLPAPAGYPGTPSWGAIGVSNTGVIVGVLDDSMAIWRGPSYTSCTTAQFDGKKTYPSGISRNGEYITGYTPADASSGSFQTPFIYHNGVFTAIQVPNIPSATAVGVTSDGTVAGWGADATTGITHGFIWRDGVTTFLDRPDGSIGIQPVAINDAGTILGIDTFVDMGAAIWQDGNVYRLRNSIVGDSTFGFLGQPLGLNSVGQVIGMGFDRTHPGDVTPYLLTPVVPEPTTVLATISGLGVIARRRRVSLGRSMDHQLA